MTYRPTGVSAFGFGVEWEKTEGDRQIARAVVTYLEDRRLLFGERHVEDERHCVLSALDIRVFLTEQITRSKPGKDLEACLRAMRAACRQFVERGGPDGQSFSYHRGFGVDPFSIALGDLRTTVGWQLALILDQYPMDVEPDLAGILPPADNDAQDLSWLPGLE